MPGSPSRVKRAKANCPTLHRGVEAYFDLNSFASGPTHRVGYCLCVQTSLLPHGGQRRAHHTPCCDLYATSIANVQTWYCPERAREGLTRRSVGETGSAYRVGRILLTVFGAILLLKITATSVCTSRTSKPLVLGRVSSRHDPGSPSNVKLCAVHAPSRTLGVLLNAMIMIHTSAKEL
jgi:hypothetical protein